MSPLTPIVPETDDASSIDRLGAGAAKGFRNVRGQRKELYVMVRVMVMVRVRDMATFSRLRSWHSNLNRTLIPVCFLDLLRYFSSFFFFPSLSVLV
jgi:hypothetical protein